MRFETTSSVEECALRARSTHGLHHAIVEVNIVIGVVLGEVLDARDVPLNVDAVIGLTLGLIAHVVIVVFVVVILHRIFLYGRYTLYTIMVSFLCVFGSLGLARSTTVCSLLSSTLELYTSTVEASLSVRSSLSRARLSLDVAVGDDDELEEDVEQGLSCLESVLEVD